MKFLTKAKYIKYTRAELERYTSDASSCVQKIHAREHLGISMAGLQNLRETISRILDHKIGRFDRNRNGIILDIRNTKVLDTPSKIRHDSADLHLDIEADFYVFQPRMGAIVTGVVKHISQANIGVIIYRVFNVTVKFTSEHRMRNVKVNQEIKIRVMNFDLDNRLPEIQGELLTDEKIEENDADSGISTEDVGPTKIKQERDSDDQGGPSKQSNGEDEDDIESFAKTKKRRSILVKHENGRRTTLPKHVSFNDTPVRIKIESNSSDQEEMITPTKKKTHKRLRSPSPPPKLDETEFNAFEELIKTDLQSTIIGTDTVTVKTEPSPSKSSKKRKRETKDDEEEEQVIKKKKRKEVADPLPVFVKQEPEESSSSQETTAKKKKKKNDKQKSVNSSFHTTLESILDEAEMSSCSSTQTSSKRVKVPKIKKEKF